jgi:hypothetical protein
VHLTATKPTEATVEGPQPPTGLRYGWQLVAVGGALTAALAGWIIVSGLSVVGWLAAALAGSASDMADAFHAGTSIWLLTNGAPLDLGGVHWSLIPLGVSLLTVFMISRFARAAARFAAPWGEDGDPVRRAAGSARTGSVDRDRTGDDLLDDDLPDDERADRPDEDRLGVIGRLLLGIIGLSTVGYAAVVAAVGLGTGVEITRGIVGAAVIAAAGSAWGASRGLGVRLSDVLPGWARPLPAAVAAGVGILLLSGVAVLVTGIVLHADRIGSLGSALGAGVIGGIALWAAQAAFLPNLIAWCASYALGGGFAIGQGSVVAPSDVTLGLLPSFPILGALPSSGAGSTLGLFWLAFGVAAGAVAAALVVRKRPAARVDETALAGGLAGLLAGLIFTGLSWFSAGGLGSGRLAGVGPRMLELLVMSGTLLGLSGLLCGLVLGLVRLVREVRAARADAGTGDNADEDPDDEITAAIGPTASATGVATRIRSLRKRLFANRNEAAADGESDDLPDEDDAPDLTTVVGTSREVAGSLPEVPVDEAATDSADPTLATSPATAERPVVNEADEPTAKVAVRRTAANTADTDDPEATVQVEDRRTA